MSDKDMPRVNLLGVGINAMSMEQMLDFLDEAITTRTPTYICLAPAHSVMACYDDPLLMDIYNKSGVTTPDGMPAVWFIRLSGYRHVERVYGPDLLLAVCSRSAERGYRHFFYGGTEQVMDQLTARLNRMYPGLQIAGFELPPFRDLTAEEDDMVIEYIRKARPDIVWVGIGSPRQEKWMSDHVGRLGVPVLVGVGAAFDFISGVKPQAPPWIQRSGLEWLFRFFIEPRRLWRRYILNYPRFVVLVLLQIIGLKRFRLG